MTENAATPDLFAAADIIYAYTRRQAVDDGLQVLCDTLVPGLSREAGFKIPVYLTTGVFESCVQIPEGVTCQDVTGRLWDVLWMTRYAIACAGKGASSCPVELRVRNAERRPPQKVHLWAEIGPVDIDDPTPCITVMLPEER